MLGRHVKQKLLEKSGCRLYSNTAFVALQKIHRPLKDKSDINHDKP